MENNFQGSNMHNESNTKHQGQYGCKWGWLLSVNGVPKKKTNKFKSKIYTDMFERKSMKWNNIVDTYTAYYYHLIKGGTYYSNER